MAKKNTVLKQIKKLFVKYRVVELNEMFTGSHYKSFCFVRKTVCINKITRQGSLYTNLPIFIYTYTRFQTSLISYCNIVKIEIGFVRGAAAAGE